MLEGKEKHNSQQKRSQSVLVGSILFTLYSFNFDGVMALIESNSLKKGIKMHLSTAEWLGLVLTSQRVIICVHLHPPGAATGR